MPFLFHIIYQLSATRNHAYALSTPKITPPYNVGKQKKDTCNDETEHFYTLPFLSHHTQPFSSLLLSRHLAALNLNHFPALLTTSQPSQPTHHNPIPAPYSPQSHPFLLPPLLLTDSPHYFTAPHPPPTALTPNPSLLPPLLLATCLLYTSDAADEGLV